ncbi:hypothetical protein HN014_08035 [Aquimarina sp. TRL1]|uniref:hypothetical protein n=1 Tax=Aquimarina sp. (strain TRL1) TaxID=2736252 RepID=UPI001589A1C6|nr:hypothetical protein [Aquimarina sp. TRL1]QKX04867.1 hypothetical protein HN014_08035 [Aquimarina sp. TRL1]
MSAIKNTAAYRNGSIDYVIKDDVINIYNRLNNKEYIAVSVIYALDSFTVKIKAWKSIPYLEVK